MRPTARAARPTRAAGSSSRAAASPSNGFWLLALVVVVLCLVGLVMVLSASSVMSLDTTGSSWTYFIKQAMWVTVGAGALLVCMACDLRVIRRIGPLALFAAAGMLFLVLVPGLGVSANGSTRWLGFGSLSIQPAEFAKLAVLVFVADLLARRADRVHDPRFSIRPVMAVAGLFAVLLMLQPNLGTTIILVSIVMVMLFVAGAPGRELMGWGTVGLAAAVLLALAAPYRRARVLAFLHPWADPANTGYQLIQSQVGLADGGFLGLGLGASRAKWGFLPYAHTDFIFAIVGEELGLLGAALVVILFVALAFLGVRAAVRTNDRFSMLLAVGVTTWITLQAFVNIGAVIGILPITGVPLPFLSFGGSSVLFTMAATGLLLNVARHPEPAHARTRARAPRGASTRARAGARRPVPAGAGGGRLLGARLR
ncbi:MAG TPA: putative lipid II flippase FtsW [Acidimicrobiales bacterium]|nr:putative lipid II flippase FtsW [Acidimicrobiales bacterium]